MPVNAIVVSVGADHLYYFVRATGSGGEFPVYGGTMLLDWATLQTDGLLTDTPGPTPVHGAFRQVIYADLEGLGTIPANAGLTQGQARAIYLLDDTTSIGNPLVPRAHTTLTPRAGINIWEFDAGALGITITASNTSEAGQAYLRIQLVHSIWR